MDRKYGLKSTTCLAIKNVYNKLTSLQELEIGLSDYGLQYFLAKKETLHYELFLYGKLIEKSIYFENRSHPIIDFGGGIGLGSILASELGFTNVLYVDSDEHIAKDAKNLAQGLNSGNIRYYPSIREVNRIPNEQFTLFSKDVIEHIYDLSEFMKILSTNEINSYHLTTASPDNIFRKNYFKQIHHRAEYLEPNHLKKNQSTTSYYESRRNYIKNNFNELSANEEEELTKITKGLILSDIKSNLLEAKSHKNMSQISTNTCDPISGNWAERLLFDEEYSNLARKYGFNHEVQGLPYDEHKSSNLKRSASKIFNGMLSILGFTTYKWITCKLHSFEISQ